LETAAAGPEWPPVLQAYARCARIVRSQTVDGRVDAGLIEMEAERELLAAVEKVGQPNSVDQLVKDLRTLVPPITEFFDKVLVMDEDPATRANRLALVQRVVDLADGIADLSKLEGF
jgi:glycyl-tRNA synthetase beta subunit